MALNAFVFDMDGVIIDSEPLQVEAEQWTCTQFGITVPKEKWETFKGRTNRSIFEEIIREHTSGSFDVEQLITTKRARYMVLATERLVLVPGALEFLAHAKARVGRCALVTSSSTPVVKFICDRYDLHQFFDVIVTGDKVLHGKPHPEPYLMAVYRLGLDPHEACVLEDSDNGIRSAVVAGCHTIGITTSFSREMLVAHGAHDVVASYEELYPILKRLQGRNE